MYVLVLTSHDHKKRPWVAEIRGRSRSFGLDRVFLNSIKDFSSDPIQYVFHLARGVMYEVFDGNRFFCRVDEHWRLEKLPLEEILAGVNLLEMERKEANERAKDTIRR